MGFLASFGLSARGRVSGGAVAWTGWMWQQQERQLRGLWLPQLPEGSVTGGR